LPCALTISLCEPLVPLGRRQGSYTFTAVASGMQLKTPDGAWCSVSDQEARGVPLTGDSAALSPVNTPSGERVSAIAPAIIHHRGCTSRGTIRIPPADRAKAPTNRWGLERHEGRLGLGRICARDGA
jgi:hypothetical protein